MKRASGSSRATKSLGLGLILGSVVMVGCHHEQDPRGPMERAGAWVDDAAAKTGDGVKRGAEATSNGVQEGVAATGRGFEHAGQSIQGAFSSDAGVDAGR